MNWSTAERKIVDDQGKLLKDVHCAIVGDAKNGGTPGLQDEVRDIKTELVNNATAHRKMIKALIGIGGLALLCIVAILVSDGPAKDFVLKVAGIVGKWVT